MIRGSGPPAARLLSDLAALGPYFAVEVHGPGSPLARPWQPLGELISSPDALAARIGEVRERLASAAGRPASAVEFRVAASIAQLGLCARLLAPALGAAALGRALPVDAAQAWWIPALGGPFPLSLPDTAVASAGSAACVGVLTGPVGQVVRSAESMAVSPQVLWGNVASAVSGAVTMIAAARPDLAAAAADAAMTVLGQPVLAGTYRGRPGAGFRRRSCCLIYRLSPSAPAYCGDCVLGPRAQDADPRSVLTRTQHAVTPHQQGGATVSHPLWQMAKGAAARYLRGARLHFASYLAKCVVRNEGRICA